MKSEGPHPNLWHPFTPVAGMPAPLRVVRGHGALLDLEDGRSVLDCISSWWVNLHGHAHPRIAEAIHRQAETLEQVIFAGFTHEPAERLAESLAERLPGSLSHVFYSDDGSTSVEVALKMAAQHWRNRGEERTSFVAFEGAYHGDTFGAMAAGERSLFTETFTDLLFDVTHLPFPATWIGDEEVGEKEWASLAALERALRADPGRVAGVIVEPLVQGAGGMRMCRPEFLRELARVVREHGTLLIFDEVMTGFGRTGEWFACRRADVSPDIICLAKGLTGGFVPLAVTVASEDVYESFRSDDPAKTLWHGHSYTANPIGCAAALASIDLLMEDEDAFRGMEAKHVAFLKELSDDDPLDNASTGGGPRIVRPRVTGTIAAFEVPARERPGYLDSVGVEIRRRALDHGLLLRPLGNTVYLMPPYCLSGEEREAMYEGVKTILDDLDERASI